MVVCFCVLFCFCLCLGSPNPTPRKKKNLGDSILFGNNPKEQEWEVEHVLRDEKKPIKCELRSDYTVSN